MKRLTIFHKTCLIILFYAFCGQVNAQMSVKDSSILIPHFDVVYSMQMPAGDLVDRFGLYNTIGAAFYVKDRNGFVYGIDGQYQFGNRVKELTIDNLLTQNGKMLNADGEYSALKLFMRGYRFSAQIGKVFKLGSVNPNSGLKVLVGAGFWQHRIRVDDIQLNSPQIKFPYQKGYDRMTNGFLLTQFVGYQFFSNTRLINFYVGFEFNQGFTKNRRAYNFSEKRKDNSSRFDMSYGFKVGWVIPFYKKAPQDFYYN